jgi:hypothetical protein
MTAIVRHIRWVMLVCGLLTATMVQVAMAPDAALQSTFGETVQGPLAHLLARSWGTLVALVGVMLIYGAFVPPVRNLVLSVAGLSKAIFVVLVLAEGGRYLGERAGIAVVTDSLVVLIFVWYLVAARRLPPLTETRP